MRAARSDQYRVAVRRRFCRQVGAYRASGAAAIVGDNLMADCVAELLPAGNGTIMRTGFVGYVCAGAIAG